MRLAWHIARKDLRRLRWPLVLWGLLLASKLVLGAVLVWGTIEGNQRGYNFFTQRGIEVQVLTISECVAAFLLTAAILHGDVLTGTTAFWQTRPISGGRLLLGKAIALAVVFAVIPCGIYLPWWIACGFGAKEILLGSVDTVFWLTLVVAGAFPLAALTNGFSRFLTWSFVLIFAFVCMCVMLLPAGSGLPTNALAIGLIRVVAAVVLFLTLGVASGLTFFLRRRWMPALALLGCGVGLAVWSANDWPLRWQPRGNELAEGRLPGRSGPLSAGVRISFEEAHLATRSEKSATIWTILRYDGVPRGYFISQFGEQPATHRWDWPGGIHWETKESIYPPNPDWASRFEPLGLLDSGNQSLLFLHLRAQTLRIDPAYIPAIMRDRPAYHLEAHLALQRYEMVWERPLKTESTWKGGANADRAIWMNRHFWNSGPTGRFVHNARMVGAQWSRETLVLVVMHRRPVFGVSLVSSGIWKLFPSNFGPPVDFLLIDSSRTVISHASEGAASMPVRVAGVEIILGAAGLEAPLDYSDPNHVTSRPGWRDNVTLAKVVTRNVETFTTETSVDHFELQPMKEKGGAP